MKIAPLPAVTDTASPEKSTSTGSSSSPTTTKVSSPDSSSRATVKSSSLLNDSPASPVLDTIQASVSFQGGQRRGSSEGDSPRSVDNMTEAQQQQQKDQIAATINKNDVEPGKANNNMVTLVNGNNGANANATAPPLPVPPPPSLNNTASAATPQRSSSRSRRHKHRRSASDDVPRMVQGSPRQQPQQQHPQQQYPQQQQHPQYVQQPQPQQQQFRPPSPYGYGQYQQHIQQPYPPSIPRGRAWSGEPSAVIDPQQWMMQGGGGGRPPPAAPGNWGPFPTTSPTNSERHVVHGNYEGQPLLMQQQQMHALSERPRMYHARSTSVGGSAFPVPGVGTPAGGGHAAAAAAAGPPPPRRHRRALSSSSAMPQYGSMWSDAPHSPSQNKQAVGFSPRNELMGNLASLSPKIRSGKKSMIMPPGSPRSQSISYQEQYQHQQRGSPQVSWSPVAPPHVTSSLRGLPTGLQSPFLLNSSEHSVNSVSNGGPLAGTPGGGEAVYAAQQHRSTRSGLKKHESSRKMHMRQKSAQMFMADTVGSEQPPKCRDVIFLLMFVFHLLGIIWLSNTYSLEALKMGKEAAAMTTPVVGDDDSSSSSSVIIYYKNLLIVSVCSGGFAVVLSTLLLGFMTFFARRFVQVTLIVVITLSFVWGTIGIGLSPKNIVPVTGIIALALSVAYAIIVWDRIPFAAANLLTALSAVRAHATTVIFALVFQGIGLAWSIYFAVLVCGVYDSIQDGRINISDRMAVVVYIFLGISYYWTFQVLSNCVQVVTAGVIGGWWYQQDGEEREDGENTVRKSSFKTMFYAMGSICFGSLFVGPVRLVRQASVICRPATDEASLLCLHECLRCFQVGISTCVDGLAERFNPWAFTYIGLYQYGFTDAGRNAWELFEKRGWTTIVSDDLIPNVLLLTSLVIGGVTGVFCHLLAQIDDLNILAQEEQGLVAFGVGISIGVVVTSILFSLISSSVNAVIVCFATSPVDFEENHPELSHEMRAAWREVWPGALDMVDMRLAMSGHLPLTPNSMTSGPDEFGALLA